MTEAVEHEARSRRAMIAEGAPAAADEDAPGGRRDLDEGERKGRRLMTERPANLKRGGADGATIQSDA